MLAELPGAVVNAIRERWSSRLALALSTVLVFIVALTVFSPVDFSKLTLTHWALAAGASVVMVLVWIATNRMPQTPKGRIGLVVAIKTEDEKYARALRSDFIDSLRRLVESPKGKNAFALVEYSPKLASAVDVGSAARFLRRSRGRFMIYGAARSRRVGGRQQHVIDLQGLVFHAPIPQEASTRFGQEMAQVLPSRVIFDRENDVFKFQLTSEVANAAAKYIVGMAALISGELEFAEQIFLELEAICQTPLRQFPTVARIRQLLPQRLARVYVLQLHPVVESYFLRRDKADLVRQEEILTKLERYEPSNYGMKIGRALCAFALRRDLLASWRYVKSCVGIPDATWRYSGAFLHAYSGNLREARRWYKLAFEGRTSSETVPIQTEEFIYLVLDEEPDKVQLHYCLGLINLYAKKDMASARREFSQFLAECPADRFQEERRLAQEHIRSADEALSSGTYP